MSPGTAPIFWTRALALAFVAAAMPAQAVPQAAEVLDFDGNVQSDFRLGVHERGYRFTSPSSLVAVIDGDNAQGAHNGTPTLWSYQNDAVMSRRDGQPFELLALDIGFYWLPSGRVQDQVTATLTRVDGTTWSQTLEVSATAFQRWAFGGGPVLQVLFDQPFDSSLRLDNLAVLSPVPEPSAWLLLASGGALLAWRRRRHPS